MVVDPAKRPGRRERSLLANKPGQAEMDVQYEIPDQDSRADRGSTERYRIETP